MKLAPKEVEAKVIALLGDIQRKGMDHMICWLVREGFFTSPASTKFHSCYAGGLANHSLGVYELVNECNEEFKLGVAHESIVSATLLHDVCKVGAYLGTSKPYTWNRAQPKGHALLSLTRIAQYLQLNVLETKMIQFHMGVYGLREFESKKGEYMLRGDGMANAWYHHPIVKIMYFCDELECFQAKADDI